MVTLKNLKLEAAKLNAKIMVGDFDSYDQSTLIEVEAPDGMKWSEGSTQIISASKYSYIKGSAEEAYSELINRMSYGLEKLTEDDK